MKSLSMDDIRKTIEDIANESYKPDTFVMSPSTARDMAVGLNPPPESFFEQKLSHNIKIVENHNYFWRAYETSIVARPTYSGMIRDLS